MPDDDKTTTTAPAVEPAAEPTTYTFPFDVPADLAVVEDADLRALHAQVREHAQTTFAALTPMACGTATDKEPLPPNSPSLCGVARDRFDPATALAPDFVQVAVGVGESVAFQWVQFSRRRTFSSR